MLLAKGKKKFFFLKNEFFNFLSCRRLHKELMGLMMSSDKGVSAFPEGENLFKWIGTITGPNDTVRKIKHF